MSVKKLTIDCDCKVSVCDHAFEKVGELLQSGYDDGYDEGWQDAFIAIKEGLLDLGFEKASSMGTPPPPPRRSRPSSGISRSRVSKKIELSN